MKTKSTISAVLVLCFSVGIFTACYQQAGNETTNDYIISMYTDLSNNGELFSDDTERLSFCDFTTMTTAIICPNPNCNHSDEKTCLSFGMRNHPILYNGSLYFFQEEIVTARDGFYYDTYIMKADTDGTNRSEIDMIEGLGIFAYTRMLVRGSKLFFVAEDVCFDEYGTSSGLYTVYVCSYDLATGEFTQSEALYSGYSGGHWLYGAVGDHIYISYSVSDVELDYTDLEAVMQLEQILIDYNIADGTLTRSDKKLPAAIGKGYYVYTDDSGTTVLGENSTVIAKSSVQYSDCTIVNDKLFVVYENKCFDIKSQKDYTLNINDTQIEVIDFIDGKYILKQWTPEGYKYTAMTEEELVGDEAEV
jgi:hypothetical protein